MHVNELSDSLWATMSGAGCQDVIITTDSAPEAEMIHFSENHVM